MLDRDEEKWRRKKCIRYETIDTGVRSFGTTGPFGFLISESSSRNIRSP